MKEYNFLRLAENQLVDIIRDSLEQEVTERLLNEFKEKAAPIIKEEVNKLVIDSVESMRDMAQVRDELHVYCHHES